MNKNKLRVAVLFGGISPEHEVSIISGLQAIEHLDKEKFEAIPVYITKEGKWYSGPELTKIETFRNLAAISEKGFQVTVTFDSNKKGLLVTRRRNFFNKFSEIVSVDVIFPVFHGGLGENGGLAGIYESMQLPYVGPGITGGALGMDKIVMKQLFMQTGIPIARWCGIYRSAFEKDRSLVIKKIESVLRYPMFVKPATGGSSIGTTKAHNKKELENAIEVAAVFDRKLVVEESIENAREINVSVLGNAGSELMVSVCEEVFSENKLLTFEDKYIGEESKTGKGVKSHGMLSTKRQIPAIFSKEIERRIQETAKKVFETLEGSGVSRIDFLYQQKTKKIFVIESNTIPGSLSFYLWEASGLSFKDMLTKLINLALERYEESQKNTTTFSTNILEKFNAGGSKSKLR